MKNKYEIINGEVIIYMKKRDGTIFKALISLSDLERAKEFSGTWNYYHVGNNKWYVQGRLNKKMVYLHRWITYAEKSFEVDHRVNNTLDNRRSNLRICTHAQNMQNRQKYRTNKSGVRGVSFDKLVNKWRSQVQINGKQIYIGIYNSIEEAKKAVLEYRKKYMPFSVEEVY